VSLTQKEAAKNFKEKPEKLLAEDEESPK